uniref:tRNA-synt_1d domain-containing protein n=1 Tax=Macrostomum lignano TaxID=282301 RepID=A0A1I8FD86_9PLAT
SAVSDAVSAVIRAGPPTAWPSLSALNGAVRDASCPRPGPQSARQCLWISALGQCGQTFARLVIFEPRVLGNFVVQINRAFGHRVSEQVSRLAVQHMQSVYARAGTELPAEAVESAYARLESGEPQAMRLWRLAKRALTGRTGRLLSARLSVSFDRLEFESDYAKQTGKTAGSAGSGAASAAPDGAKLLRLADSADDEAVVQKRDGSSLYFGRDLLAALDRADNLGCGRAPLRLLNRPSGCHFDRLGRRPDRPGPSGPGQSVTLADARRIRPSGRHEHQAERLRRSGTAPPTYSTLAKPGCSNDRKRRQIDESTGVVAMEIDAMCAGCSRSLSSAGTAIIRLLALSTAMPGCAASHSKQPKPVSAARRWLVVAIDLH